MLTADQQVEFDQKLHQWQYQQRVLQQQYQAQLEAHVQQQAAAEQAAAQQAAQQAAAAAQAAAQQQQQQQAGGGLAALLRRSQLGYAAYPEWVSDGAGRWGTTPRPEAALRASDVGFGLPTQTGADGGRRRRRPTARGSCRQVGAAAAGGRWREPAAL